MISIYISLLADPNKEAYYKEVWIYHKKVDFKSILMYSGLDFWVAC